MSKSEIKAIAKKTATKAAKRAIKEVKENALKKDIAQAKAAKTDKPKTDKVITSRVVSTSITGLGMMPVKVYSTTYKGETFEHTDKKAVKQWRKEQKQVNKKPIDPIKFAARLENHVRKAIKVLGKDIATDTLNQALNA